MKNPIGEYINYYRQIIGASRRNVYRKWFHSDRSLRQCKIYGVGAPKTGTTSISTMFPSQFSTAHEPQWFFLIPKIVKYKKSVVDRSKFKSYILQRDKILSLDVESNFLIVNYVDLLVEEFPDAKFILTIREPRSWLNTMVEWHYDAKLHHSPRTKVFRPVWKMMFESYDSSYTKFDHFLEEMGLPPTESYLRYWRDHNSKIKSEVPSDNLLIIQTEELSISLSRIEVFLGLPEDTLMRKRSHSKKSSMNRVNIIDRLDEGYVEDLIASHCCL